VLQRCGGGYEVAMNREERRHPDKDRETKAPQEREINAPQRPEDEASIRAKSTGHKKVTADKWNQ
jgi:hypothetical protein